MIHYNDSDYLCHYGVPGMKWGVKKSPEYRTNRANAKAGVKQAKQQLRAARRSKGGYVGIKGLARARKKQQAIDAASMNLINKKAAYAASKKTNAKAAEKAEFKTYRKEMQKSGLVGSAADSYSGGRSTKLYDNIKTQKGKEYADKIHKSVQNHAVAAIAGSTAVFVGSTVAQAMLNRR